jgi:hypothetical protein
MTQVAGLEADRYYCAQDYVAPYNKAPIKATIAGDRAKAVLTLMANDTLTFDMKKENNKWLIAKLGCNAGVNY